jgi:integrase
MIRIPSHIHRSRHGIWFFRVVVPKNLRRALDGRGEIKKSLGTRDAREALRVARPLAFAAKELFARLEASLSRPPTVDEILANAAAARELKTTNTVDLGGGKSLSYSLETTSNDPAEFAAFHAEAARLRAQQDEQLAAFREQPFKIPEAMLEYQRKQSEEMARFKEELASERAAQELAQPEGEGEEEVPPFKPDPENVLSARWAEYVKQREGNTWTAGRTTPAYMRMFEEFQAWWGEDLDIRFITRKVVNRFIVHLQTQRMVMSGARKGQPGLDGRSVDNYTSVLNTFLEWAQEKGYFPDSRRLPTAKQAIVKKAARVRRKDKANPAYTPRQLKQLFDHESYKFDLAHHFWPPLIALFTGARRREIAQLLVDDFRVVDGIPAISIDILDDDDKSVKTEAAKRLIPVHPELIAIGLLDYVEDVRSQGLGAELFPGIGTNKHKEKGNAIGNAWRRYRETKGMAGESAPTFHSFRSSALKVLKANGVSFEMRCQLAGHEINHVGQTYDDTPIGVKDLMEVGIPRFRYDGLDLSKIRYVRNQFERTNAMGVKQVVKREKEIAQRAAEAKGAVEAKPKGPAKR